MLNCKEATELASNALEEKLSFSKSLSLKVHLFICHRCRQYVNQLNFLQHACNEVEKKVEETSATLSDEARQRIQDMLNRKQK